MYINKFNCSSFRYYKSNRLTEKSDVFSFGVVLLEIVSCKPVRPLTESEAHIIKWVNSMAARGDINGIIDRRLDSNYEVNSVWKAVEIAITCVSENPGRRPSMNQVVAELKNCLAIELERIRENQALNSTDSSMNTMSIVLDYTASHPSAR